ncbi:hypothetical protein CEE37_01590 [candidate division LCP-89 bacterium B3_LCP]|uniref:Uncharacterized protein n=1 Tax=candidate division LCP-89 bacterium B3_LCP TaxID=2012998 RepID=A0A532V5D8_UNCL8|nr:MAG: hypothetical protein CEE37_01590 [candidate division LCP-89 bacterium B3_LCP]
MAYTVKVKDFDDSPKKITSTNVRLVMGASAMYFDSNSSTLDDEESFTNSDLNWVVITNDSYVEFEFEADNSGSDGQGLHIPVGYSEVKVTSVTGTVKKLAVKNANFGHTKATAYSDGSSTSVSANDIVNGGDFVVCSKSSKFQIKFTTEKSELRPFTALPIGLLFDSDR